MVKNRASTAGVAGSIPGQGAKIPRARQRNQRKKKSSIGIVTQ